MESILQQLRSFRDRVYCASFRGNDDVNNYNVKDTVPLSRVIEAVQHLITNNAVAMDDMWTYTFLRRVERTMRGMPEKIEKSYEPDDDFLRDKYLVKPWKLYLEECQFILADWNYELDNDDVVWTRRTRVCRFENELERRKNQFESIHDRQNTFQELCEKHPMFLAEYLGKCISFHSSIPIQGLDDGDEYRGNANHVNAEELWRKEGENPNLGAIEIPLRLSAARLLKSVLLPSNTNEPERTAASFIPSLKETFIETSGMSRQNIADVLERCRWIFVLGDPGCGKTTLVRWLMLQFACLIVRSRTTLSDIGRHLDKWQRLAIRFGLSKTFYANCSIRLPILIRIAELITWLDLHPTSTIMDYIGYQTWFTVPYAKGEHSLFLREFIFHGHAFLLFDGLDEVSNYDERKQIVNLINVFIEEYVRTPAHISVNDVIEVVDEWGGSRCERPKFVGGNQVIITSRVMGYYLYPIKATMSTLFTLSPMNKKEAHVFIDHWLVHVPYGIACSIHGKMVREKGRIIRKKEETEMKELLYSLDENLWSHPMLLSLLLPILYRKKTDIIELGTRIQLYDIIVRSALSTWTRTHESKLNSETLYWLLCNMAFYIHTRCPSGLIDSFDLTHLLCISLRELCKHKRICKSNEWLKKQADEFVHTLASNSIGFIVARGLDAYGFVHLTFQEYFVALSIVNPHIDGTPFAIDRFLDHALKLRFREPLTLAIEWIKWKWKPDDFDAFCIELSKKFIGRFPIGALLLSNVLGSLSNTPGVHILSRLFTVLVTLATNRNLLEYLAIGLSKTKAVSTLIEHLLDQNTNIEGLCRFLVHSLQKDKYGQFFVPRWLSEASFLRLEAYADTSEIIETTIDSVFRDVRGTRWSEKLQPSNSFSNLLTVGKLNVHPTVLSLLIVLCGGLHYAEPKRIAIDSFSQFTPEPIQFSASRMHRSTTLSDVLSSYFADEEVGIPNTRLENLIEKFREIILTASTSDVSRRVVDAFVALICLRGLGEPLFYEHLLRYHALPRALYRMRLALYHMRQLYRDKRSYSSVGISMPPHAKCSSLKGSQILEKVVADPGIGVSSATSFTAALCAAFTRLFYHASSANVLLCEPLPALLSENQTFFRNILSSSAHGLRLMLNPCSKDATDDATKWDSGLHPFQIYCNYPLFPVAFISSKFRSLFERLVSIKQLTNKETLPFVVLLAEVLLSIQSVLLRRSSEVPLKILLLLRVLENDIRQHRLDSYSQAIVHGIKTEVKRNDWHFSDCYRGMTKAQSESALKLAVTKEQERIHEGTDIQLFAASIGLARAVTSINNGYNELLEEARKASLTIRDPILRILCLRHIREIVRSCVDTKYYWSVQNDIVVALENMAIDDIPLVVLTLVLGACEEEQAHPSMERLLDCIWKRLQCVPTCDEERRDQETVFQAIRHIVGHLQVPIPLSSLTCSTILQPKSPIFHTVFQTTTFSSSETILLAQLYLVQLTVDAQVLTQFRLETGSLSMSLPSSCTKTMLRHLWKPHFGKFSHRQVVLINSLVLSASVDFEDISFDKLEYCLGFEEKTDRPIVESWLKYFDDERRAQVAVLGVFLLIRAQQDMAPITHSMVELIFTKGLSSKVDSIRRVLRACFPRYTYYWGWSTSMWHLLRNIMISSLGDRLAVFGMGTVQQMRGLLEIERQRLSTHHPDDPYARFSLLSLIAQTWNNDGSDIQIYLSEILMPEDHVQDIYLAFVIFHIVRKCAQQEWCDKLFELLHSLLYNANLPSTQIAAVYTLASQKRGRKILLDVLDVHFDQYDSQESDEQKCLIEPELVACLIALTNSHRVITNNDSLCSLLWPFCHSVESKSVRVQRHFQACYLSHMNDENNQALAQLHSLFELTVRDVYTLYMINTSCFALEWREREYWMGETAKFMLSCERELLAQFVADLYVSLSVRNGTNEFQNPEPNYLAIASIMNEDNSDLFCQAVRASVFGEGEFKNALYLLNKQGTTMDQRTVCVTLYASFGILTEQLIEMVFAICLEDFSPLQSDIHQWYTKVTEADRENIESIFPYLESASIHQRRLAMGWLLRLVKLDILSIHEVQQLLLEKDLLKIAEKDDEFGITSEWYHLMCLEPLYNREYFAVLSPEAVEADFFEVSEAPYLQFS